MKIQFDSKKQFETLSYFLVEVAACPQDLGLYRDLSICSKHGKCIDCWKDALKKVSVDGIDRSEFLINGKADLFTLIRDLLLDTKCESIEDVRKLINEQNVTINKLEAKISELEVQKEL